MIYYVSDRTYRRLLGLFDIATSLQYKQEVIGGAFGNYLMNGRFAFTSHDANVHQIPYRVRENWKPYTERPE